jgi:hypothetical protein
VSDTYPADIYPRAPPAIVARLHRLLATHFPSLTSLSRYQAGPALEMKLRRKWTTGSWPPNRLAYFASPWYARLGKWQVAWKFETSRGVWPSGEKIVENRDSDSNSDIDEDGAGVYEIYDNDDEEDTHVRLGLGQGAKWEVEEREYWDNDFNPRPEKTTDD